MDRWYVAQTKPRYETTAVWHLQNQGFETFYPLLRRRTGVYTSITLPLFPSYVFVLFDIENTQWRCINGTRGVHRLMAMHVERPSPVPSDIMHELLATGGIVEDMAASLPFLKGQMLEFTDGPMKGQQGVCEIPGPKRVALLLSVLGRKTLVYSDAAHLKVSPADSNSVGLR